MTTATLVVSGQGEAREVALDAAGVIIKGGAA